MAPGMRNVLGWPLPLPTGQKVSLPALKDVLGTQRARDKGPPSGPLTPSLRPLPAGGCPCSCLPSSAAPSPEGGCVNPWRVPRQCDLALSQPALHPDRRFPGSLTAGAHHPEAGSGACPMSRWCPQPPGSASAVRETLNLTKPSGAAGQRVSAREVCPPEGSCPRQTRDPRGPSKSRGWEARGPRSTGRNTREPGARGRGGRCAVGLNLAFAWPSTVCC